MKDCGQPRPRKKAAIVPHKEGASLVGVLVDVFDDSMYRAQWRVVGMNGNVHA